MENGNPVIFHLEIFVLCFVSLHMWCYDGCCSGVYEVAVSDAYLFLSRSRKSSLIYFSIIIIYISSFFSSEHFVKSLDLSLTLTFLHFSPFAHIRLQQWFPS